MFSSFFSINYKKCPSFFIVKEPKWKQFITFLDADECNDGTHDCDTNGECTNTVSSFKCACKTGYTGNGKNGNCAGNKYSLYAI